MGDESNRAEDEGVLESLRGLRGATSLQLPAGQVLLHRRHLAPGVFLVLTGELEAVAEKGRPEPTPSRLTGSATCPAVLPLPGQLESPSEETWAVAEPVRLLYLPLTLVRENAPLRERLRQLAESAGT